MTFGNLAENYEFAAMKSSGISKSDAKSYCFYLLLYLASANNVIPFGRV
jgi:lipopolysaccharide export system permease protein